MSFGVSDAGSGFEYSSRGLNGFFARRSSLVSPSHYLLLREILRFNREAPKLFARPDLAQLTLGKVMAEGRYADVFIHRYLFPMAAAVWSMPPSAIYTFPAMTLLTFFRNHGMLGINTHPQWKVLVGGSKAYLPPLTAPFRDRIFTGVEIRTVTRGAEEVTLYFTDRPDAKFDEVVFACHGNQILQLLESPTPAERNILLNFQTSRNETVLHTDSMLLPLRPAARASWNYALHPDPSHPATLTYHMNRLQSLRTPVDYCVTLNDEGGINPNKVIRRMVYHHPIYTSEAVRAQSRWQEISGHNRTHFCGAYWHYGFHEDGLNSALRVARALGAVN
jgi:predicted NAD/FAD-binding protein